MNSKKIEMNSIIRLKLELERCNHIITEIPDNDRTPSWDGNVIVYNTHVLEKKNMLGLIHAQVKGKKVQDKDIAKAQISYPVEISDLKNFRNVGGTILFVVYMVDYERYKIYYNSLLPLDLEELLSNIEIDQKTKSVKLNEFPINNSQISSYIFSSFVKNSKKQHSTAQKGYIKDPKIIKQFDTFTFSTIKFSSDYVFKLPTYIYGRNNNLDVDFPLIKITPETIETNNIDFPVTIDGITFYDYVSVEKSLNTTTFKIGAGFSIEVEKEKLNYISQGSLDERIKDLEFTIGLCKGKTLKIGNILESKNIKMHGFNLKKLGEELNFYNSLRELMKRLDIKAKLDLDNISPSELRDLETLVEAILHKKSVPLKKNNQIAFLAKQKISNLRIAIWVQKIEDTEEYTLSNPFDIGFDKGCMLKYDGIEEVPSSIYILLKKKDFLDLSNINYENMLKGLFSVPYSKVYGEVVNLLFLEMLASYDEQVEKNSALINSTITIAKWLTCQEADNYSYTLNYLQSIRRTRELNNEEIQLLHKKRESEIKTSYNLLVLLGISILLENKADYNYYFEKLEKDDKETFIKFPIYNLAKSLLN